MTRRFRRTPIAAAVLASMTVHAPFAWGQEAEAAPLPPADDAVQLPEVQVEGETVSGYKTERASSPKYTEPLRDIPQSITVVPQQVIQERAATTLKDVMRNVSGMSVVAGEGGGAQGDVFRIRGFAANNDLYLDGMRDLAQTSRDPFNLDSVEVAKGPSSSIAGRGATGGAINQVSKQPYLKSLRAGTFMLGTDATRRVTGDFNEPLGNLGQGAALRVNVMAHDAEVEKRDEIFNSRWGIAPSLAFGLGTPTRYVFSLFHQDDDNLPEYGLPFNAGVPVRVAGERLDRSNYYGVLGFDTEETRASAATFKVEHDFDKDLSLRNQLRYSLNKRFSIQSVPRNPDPTLNTVNRNFAGRDSEYDLLINQTDVTQHLRLGSTEHVIVGGLELSRENFDNVALTFTPTPQATSLTDPDPHPAFVPVIGRGALADNEAKTVAVYLQDTFKVSEQFELVGGLRREHFKVDAENTTAAGVTTNDDRNDKETTWRLGGVYKPVEHASFYAAYGTSFNPSAEAVTLSGAVNANNSADLAPEKNRGYELGTKWDIFDEHLAVTAALFRIEKTNARTRDPADPATVPTVLDGEQVVDGVELGIGGNLTREWQAFASTTFLDSEITESRNPAEEGNEIGNTPKKTLNFWTTYQLPQNFDVGLGGLYVSDRTVSNTVTTKLDSYTVFDAMVGYQWLPSVRFQANLYNITDKLYFDRFHGGGQHGIPGQARTLLVSASFAF